jgi:hypothetical protein
MGNANDQGLVIGETTLGGLSELSNYGKDYRNGTIIDYGTLIHLTLQRAATAREAIDVMHSLTSTYGYASDMEGVCDGPVETPPPRLHRSSAARTRTACMLSAARRRPPAGAHVAFDAPASAVLDR